MLPWLLSLLACEPSHSPEWVAQQACATLPGLQLESAAQAMGAKALHPEELQIWHDDGHYGAHSYTAKPYGAVIEAIGLEGMGVLRANSLCRLEGIDWQADGTGLAHMVRSEPLPMTLADWDAELVVEQPRVERAFDLLLVETEQGWRAKVGLVEAREAAEAAEALANAGDFEGAQAAYTELHARFPDPRILLRQDQLMAKAALARALDQATLDEVDGSLYYVNNSDTKLPRGRVSFTCGEIEVAQDHPAVPAGERWWLGIPDVVDPSTCELPGQPLSSEPRRLE